MSGSCRTPKNEPISQYNKREYGDTDFHQILRNALLPPSLKKYIKQLQKERDKYHNQYHLCEAKLLSHKSIIEQLLTENQKIKRLLRRAKKTFEPFPIVSDLRSMTQRLREKHTDSEAEVIMKAFAKHKAKFRKLYRDIEQALKGKKGETNEQKGNTTGSN